MGRKIFLATAVLILLLVALTTSPFGIVGAREKPAAAPDEQRITANNVGNIFGAPFRALGNLFRGGRKKKKEAAGKITEKDIAKFESSEVSRVTDAKTPRVTSTIDDRTLTARVQRARDLINADQLNEAITELAVAASLDPKSGEVHMLLGVAYDRKGLGARARDAFETAAHSRDDQAMHLNNLGFLLYRQGEYGDAIKHLKRAAKINPAENKIWNNLALVQLAAEKYDDAYKSSVHVLGEYGSRLKIAQRLESRGRTKDAIKHLEKANALQPASPEVLSQLAKLYDSSGQNEKAQVVRQALASLQAVATVSKQK